MSTVNPRKLAGFLAIIWAFFAVLLLVPGALYLNRHEADTLHLLDIVTRMGMGQAVHSDFQTPLGTLAFWPMALFQQMGLGAGVAFIAGQLLAGAVMLPLVIYIGISRLRGWLAYAFGAAVIILCVALVPGGTDAGISVAMHYNRWGWALAFCAIVLAILPANGTARPVLDGVLIGVALSALVLVKATFFVAFALPIAFALAVQLRWRTAFAALAVGLVAVLIGLVVGGPAFWLDYAADLLAVSGSQSRPNAGRPLAALVVSPEFLLGTILVIGTPLALRQIDRALEGLMFLLFGIAFVVVTWQNYGNDPKWLALAGLLLLTWAQNVPAAQARAQTGVQVMAVVALATIFPSFANLAISPMRHLKVDRSQYQPINASTDDVRTVEGRMLRVDARVAYEDIATSLAPLMPEEGRKDVIVFQGDALPRCGARTGFAALDRVASAQLREQAGLDDTARIYVADVLQAIWLEGPFAPLKGGAAWNYGTLAGWEDAQYLMVPKCPSVQLYRAVELEAIEQSGATLSKLIETDLLFLYAVEHGTDG